MSNVITEAYGLYDGCNTLNSIDTNLFHKIDYNSIWVSKQIENDNLKNEVETLREENKDIKKRLASLTTMVLKLMADDQLQKFNEQHDGN